MNFLKYIPWVIIVLAVASLAIWQWRVATANENLLTTRTTELQAANLEIGRAHTQITDETIVHKIAMAELDEKLKAEIKKNNALVVMYASLEAKYNTIKKRAEGLAATVEALQNATTIADLPVGKLFYKKDDGTLSEVVKISWKQNDFRIDMEGDATPDGFTPEKTIKLKTSIAYALHQRFKVQVIETMLPNKVRNHYAKLWELDDKGNKVGELQLTDFQVLAGETFPSKMMWWDPKLDLMVGGVASTKLEGAFSFDVGVSFSAYGKTKDDITWRFFRVGIGSTRENLSFSVSPGAYNLGKNLPLVSNLWITPVVGYSLEWKTFYFGGGLSVVF